MLSAQHFSDKGRFSVDFPTGCVPATVHITQHKFLGQPRNYDYGVIEPRTEDTTFTYTLPGVYKIIQLIDATVADPDLSKYDTLTFEVYDSPQPNFEVYTCTNRSVLVQVEDDYYEKYRVSFNEMNVVEIPPNDSSLFSYNMTTETAKITVKGLFTNSDVSECGELSKQVEFENTLIAPAIDTAFLQENCNGNYLLNIEFSSPSDFKTKIQFDDGANTSTLFEGRLSNNLIVEDLNLNEDTEKCLTVISTDVCTGMMDSSQKYCVQFNAVASDYFQKSYASYQGEDVLISFKTSFSDSILIQKKSSNSAYQDLTETISPFYIHRKGSRHTLDSYRLTPKSSSCNQTTQEIILSPPFIKLTGKSSFTNEITLQLSEPNNQLKGIPIKQAIFYSQDSTIINSMVYQEKMTLPPTVGTYQKIRLIYTYESGERIFSNEILTRINYQVHVPTAFTPNSDGLNDVLRIFGLPTNKGSIQVYNKWGEIIYQSDDIITGWNGRIQNSNAPEGTYRYKVYFEIPEGGTRTQVGTFVLIR